ncbi:MAG TPA: PAS domain-containing protein, partial [Acidobacteriota bacterium]|nr:PAS domain-containing protein [Acidobacteriota bacterium]
MRSSLHEAVRLAQAVEQIAEGLAILDLQGRILFANHAFSVHHGRGPEEMAGRPLADILRIDDAEQQD